MMSQRPGGEERVRTSKLISHVSTEEVVTREGSQRMSRVLDPRLEIDRAGGRGPDRGQQFDLPLRQPGRHPYERRPSVGMTEKPDGVLFVDLHAQVEALEPAISEAIASVIGRTAFILGAEVAELEHEFADYCGVSHAVGLDSGFSALELGLRALNIGPGDEVITQANTFCATVSAIMQAGGTPVLVDCDERGGIDPAALEASVGDRTRAVIPVYLFGRIGDIDTVLEVASRLGLLVLEDACQAIGALLDGRRAGSFGDAAAFSFYPGKNLGAFGDAGMLVAGTGEVVDWAARVRHYGQALKYDHRELPLNRRLDTIQAAVLLVKLPHLDDWNHRREWLADAYRERLADLPIELPQAEAPGRHVYHLFVIQADNRDALRDGLEADGIETGIHYPTPTHLLPAFSDLGYRQGQFPRTEAMATRMLSLPMYPEMTIESVDRVTESIRRFYGG